MFVFFEHRKNASLAWVDVSKLRGPDSCFDLEETRINIPPITESKCRTEAVIGLPLAEDYCFNEALSIRIRNMNPRRVV